MEKLAKANFYGKLPIGSKMKSGSMFGWRRNGSTPSLPESYRTIQVSQNTHWLKRLFAFAGPGYLVAVGYMDPGNWATDLAGGSRFGYTLLSVILISNFMAMFLQALCAKLGIVGGRDLAQACRDSYSPLTSRVLWVACELAIAACDLAEVLGSAIALNLLFGIPIFVGCIITVADVLLILLLQNKGFRWIESIVLTLILTIGACFGYLVMHSGASISDILRGFIPRSEILSNPPQLYIAIGILGATVMPHNLYLHSSIVQTRNFGETSKEKKQALNFAVFDSTFALLLALFINSAILIVAAAAFFNKGHGEVAEIQKAYQLLTPVLGAAGASIAFGIALLASGQNSTLTGTLAGQIVMEGFLDFRLPAWLRRLITRLIATIPALIVIGIFGESKVTDLLLLSQVILSFQLPFAVFPLIQFTSDKAKMGEFVNRPLTVFVGYSLAVLITAANVWLLWQTFAPKSGA